MGSCYWLCWLLPCWRVGVPSLQEDVFVVRHHHYRRGSRGRAGIHSLDAELVQHHHGLTLKDTSYRLFSPILTGFAFDVFLFKEITS